MKKLCIKEFVLDGLIFTVGISYEVQYNNILNKLTIYNPHGYTFIDKSDTKVSSKIKYIK